MSSFVGPRGFVDVLSGEVRTETYGGNWGMVVVAADDWNANSSKIVTGMSAAVAVGAWLVER